MRKCGEIIFIEKCDIHCKMSQQAAASEDPEPAGGEGRPGEEEERKKEEEEKEANKVVENGGLPGPTVVVQSRTIRSDAFLQLQIEKKESSFITTLQSSLNSTVPSKMKNLPRIRFLDQLSPGAQQRYADEQVKSCGGWSQGYTYIQLSNFQNLRI